MELIEHYLSLQGEGLHSGRLTYFVRFARCNLRCTWCDSTYTFVKGTQVSFKKIASAIKNSGAVLICLTGGEPLLHLEDCKKLIRHFPRHHFDLETGGSLAIRPFRRPNVSIIMDWKLKNSGMSHKMQESNLAGLRPKQDLLKLVTDFSPAERREIEVLIRKTEKMKLPISLQPVHGLNPRALAEWIVSQKNPRLQLNLQLHKIVWPGVQRGV